MIERNQVSAKGREQSEPPVEHLNLLASKSAGGIMEIARICLEVNGVPVSNEEFKAPKRSMSEKVKSSSNKGRNAAKFRETKLWFDSNFLLFSIATAVDIYTKHNIY